MSSIRRRDLLSGLSGLGLAMPFLEALRPGIAHAGAVLPKRLLIVHHTQGTMMSDWLPTGSELDFSLGPILSPLERFKDRLVVVAGVDNMLQDVNPKDQAHNPAETSLLTANTYRDLDVYEDGPASRSIDAVVAERLAGSTPYDRLDFAIGGLSATGYETSNTFWHGPLDPVTFTNDPMRWFGTLFAPDALDAKALAALHARRASILDVVMDSFGSMRKTLGTDDRIRLDAHLERVRSLERRVTTVGASCLPPILDFPAEYAYLLDDHLTTPVMIDLLVESLACDQTRVANLWWASGNNPSWHFLTDDTGAPAVDFASYGTWHQMVHSGRHEPSLTTGFTWFSEQVALLLDRLASTIGPDGLPLLDTTCVMWTTDFGNGIDHNTYKLPYLFAGNLGHVTTGRFVDHMVGAHDADWTPGYTAHGQVLVSLLQMFGWDDETFGYLSPDIPSGPLPGL